MALSTALKKSKQIQFQLLSFIILCRLNLQGVPEVSAAHLWSVYSLSHNLHIIYLQSDKKKAYNLASIRASWKASSLQPSIKNWLLICDRCLCHLEETQKRDYQIMRSVQKQNKEIPNLKKSQNVFGVNSQFMTVKTLKCVMSAAPYMLWTLRHWWHLSKTTWLVCHRIKTACFDTQHHYPMLLKQPGAKICTLY